MPRFFYRHIFAIFTILPLAAQAQTTGGLPDAARADFRLAIADPQGEVQLPDSFIVAGSERIVLNDRILQRGIEYAISFFPARLQLNLQPSVIGDTLRIRYQRLQLPLAARMTNQRYRVQIFTDDSSAAQPGIRLRSRPRRRSPDAFGSNLTKNGSLVRGISVGSNQGLKVDSGLRLQIAGQVSPGVDVVAALTDQSTPIQPEGNTQTLQEIDKVFIRLNSSRFSATLGDYELALSGTEFTSYRRKLQGAMATYQDNHTDVTVSGAISKGQFRSQNFNGIEGNQGPYQLTGDRGQIDILVLAGTERVWIDGTLMTRGENNDYVIDYAAGQITFTRRRLITSDSRIVIDFQFSDERFQRALYGAEANIRGLDNRLSLRATLLRESDDQNNPLGITLTDAFRDVLAAAGDSVAAADGALFVGAGKGSYQLIDSIYVFAGRDSGDYQVRFSDLGDAQGDYAYDGFGRYSYVGPGLGRYLPVVLLPRAQKHQVSDMRLDFQAGKYLKLTGEWALSDFDENLYSSAGDQNNFGNAWFTQAAFGADSLRLSNMMLRNLSMKLRHRRRGRKYRDIDRSDEVEFARLWDLSPGVQRLDEAITELDVQLSPLRATQIFGTAGFFDLNQGDVNSERWQAGLRMRRPDLITADYSVHNIRRDANTWLRQRGLFSRRIGFLEPEIEVEAEDKRETPMDSLRSGFRFTEWTGGVKLAGTGKIRLAAKYGRRLDDDRFGTAFQRRSDARTQRYELGIDRLRNLSFSASYIHRDRSFTDPALQNTRADLADAKIGYHAWQRALRLDGQYQITNTRIARQERVYFEVEEGEGNYIFDKNLNEYVQDPFGDFILRVLPTDTFIPVVELRSRLSLRLKPAAVLRRKKNANRLQRLLRSLSSETFLRIEEKTRDPDVREIYFLNLQRFQNPEFTLAGNISLRQDIIFFEHRRDMSLRYRLLSTEGLSNQFLSDNQENRRLRHELRFNFNRGRRFSGQLEAIRLLEDKSFEVASRPDRFIRGYRTIADVATRPVSRLELALRATFGRDRDLAPVIESDVLLIALKPRASYAFRGRGRLQADIDFTRVTANPEGNIIPYEMADGNRIGTSIRWNLGLDYRVSSNLNAVVSYQGREEPQRDRTIHLAKVEMRAFF